MIEWKEPFMQLMCKEAEKMGKVFFPYSAQGHEMKNPPDDLEVENWNGWLVAKKDAERVEAQYRKDEEALFDDDSLPFVWVTWSLDEKGAIKLTFEDDEE